MKIKQSVCYPMMRHQIHLPLDQFMRSIAQIGYAGIDIWGRDEQFADLVQLVRDNGMIITAMVGHDGFHHGLNDVTQHNLAEKELKESIDIANRNNIPGLICLSGNRNESISEQDAIHATADIFNRVAPYAEAAGVNLCLELLNSKVDHPGYQCDRTSWGVEVCKLVNSPRVKLLYDIYHMQIMEGDVIRTIQDNIAWIGHFHTAGVPGRYDIDESQELNYSAIAHAIAQTGFQGYVSHEYMPKGDVIDSLKKAYAICNS